MDALVQMLVKLGMSPYEASEYARKRIVGNKPGAEAPGNWAPEGFIMGNKNTYRGIPSRQLEATRDDEAFARGVRNDIDGKSKDQWDQPTVNYTLSSSYALLEEFRKRRAAELAAIMAKNQQLVEQAAHGAKTDFIAPPAQEETSIFKQGKKAAESKLIQLTDWYDKQTGLNEMLDAQRKRKQH